MKTYNIKKGYIHRQEYVYFDDMHNTDGWQKEVYEEAQKIAIEESYKTVSDVGCGSAYKLIKYFEKYETYGYDVEPTLSKLKEKYPSHNWRISDFSTTPDHGTDLVICADVIEHVLDPDALIAYLKKFNAKKYIFSTPERLLVKNLVGEASQNGPPANKTHIREWDFEEFFEYMSTHFKIERHWITNVEQATQTVICSA